MRGAAPSVVSADGASMAGSSKREVSFNSTERWQYRAVVALAAAMALRKALLRRKLLADEAGLLEFLFVGIFDGLFVAVACLADGFLADALFLELPGAEGALDFLEDFPVGDSCMLAALPLRPLPLLRFCLRMVDGVTRVGMATWAGLVAVLDAAEAEAFVGTLPEDLGAL